MIFKDLFIMGMGVLPALHICITCMCGMHQSQKGMPDTLEGSHRVTDGCDLPCGY